MVVKYLVCFAIIYFLRLNAATGLFLEASSVPSFRRFSSIFLLTAVPATIILYLVC